MSLMMHVAVARRTIAPAVMSNSSHADRYAVSGRSQTSSQTCAGVAGEV
jgi:hypothetical protein